MPTVSAYATPAAKAPFEKTTIERREVGPKDVRIKIEFCVLLRIHALARRDVDVGRLNVHRGVGVNGPLC